MMVHEVTGYTPDFIRWQLPLADAMQFEAVWWSFKFDKRLGVELERKESRVFDHKPAADYFA